MRRSLPHPSILLPKFAWLPPSPYSFQARTPRASSADQRAYVVTSSLACASTYLSFPLLPRGQDQRIVQRKKLTAPSPPSSSPPATPPSPSRSDTAVLERHGSHSRGGGRWWLRQGAGCRVRRDGRWRRRRRLGRVGIAGGRGCGRVWGWILAVGALAQEGKGMGLGMGMEGGGKTKGNKR
jgi:hypothetical protein